MTCEVKHCGEIRDFKKVQEYFGLGYDDNWLNALNYAISPTGELIALAQGEKLAFLSTCWSSQGNDNNTYVMGWCGELEDSNQFVTSLTCLPMTQSRSRSTDGAVEWTCVAVGLVSGLVVFYTDSGIKLFSQCCQEDPVIGIKLQSPPRHSEGDSLLYIVYPRCLCFIQGQDILPILTNSRHNVQRGALDRGSYPTADVVPFHKYKFKQERECVINDAAISSTQRPPTYDYIVQQSIGHGYFAKVHATPPRSAQVLAAGAEPYLGFFDAEEGYKTMSLGKVAKDVIGIAYKNLLGGIFRRAPEPLPSPEESPLPVPTKEAPMRIRCRLYDGKRDGLTLAVAPGGRLAVVTDNLDRVMLVDTQQAIILRVWKGYRDAQCAFVPVKERSVRGIKTHKRKALFLVIYAPRLGCLDIWALQNGPKVAAFNVSKSGHLVYNNHSALGVASSGGGRGGGGSGAGSSQSRKAPPINHCLFLDPIDGSLKEVLIPFHYALSETSSQTSRDIHMLRRLRNQLRTASLGDAKLEEIAELASELQTLEVRQQCLEMLLKSKKLQPRVFQCIIDSFIEKPLPDPTISEEFLYQIQNYKRLTDLYLTLSQANQRGDNEPPIDHLELSDADLVTINKLVLLLDDGKDEAKHATAREVSFQLQEEHKTEEFVDYLSIFNIDSPDGISLLREKADKFGGVSIDLFGQFFAQGLCFGQFKRWIDQACLPSMDLLTLIIWFWLEKPFKYNNCDEVVEDMSRIAAMVQTICDLAGGHIHDYAYNAISPWWQAVRELLLESKQFSGLLVAIVCKTVASNLWRSRKEGSCDESSQNEEEERWERITHDEAQWGLLTGKLEDVAVLGAILGKPLTCRDPVGPKMAYEPPDCSLKSIVSNGKGIVTELTAKWLISAQLHPHEVLEISGPETSFPSAGGSQKDLSKAETNSEEDLEMADEVQDSSREATEPVIERLALLRAHFPFSLESGVLLSLMSWQYMLQWSKQLSSLDHLRAALLCLSQFQTSDWALKHGICCMLWNATLKFPLQAAAKLMQKVGRLPVDKMCQQDLEMSAGKVPEFLELSLEFLEHFSTSMEHDKRELQFEQSLSEGDLPVQFLALQQHHAMPQLLQLQTELCSVLHFIAFFQLRIPKPLTTLFDAMSNKALLADINKELPYVLPSPDLVLQQVRTDFLCRVVSTTMDLIREDLEQLYINDHVLYMSKICQLADSWDLDKLPILRRQVVELYAFGYDAEAQMLIHHISEDEELGRQLLEIAGRRLNLYATSSQATFLQIASVGHQLLAYLDNLKEPLTEHNIQIAATKPDDIDVAALERMLSHAYKCLCRRESKHLPIIAQMYNAVRLLHVHILQN